MLSMYRERDREQCSHNTNVYIYYVALTLKHRHSRLWLIKHVPDSLIESNLSLNHLCFKTTYVKRLLLQPQNVHFSL